MKYLSDEWLDIKDIVLYGIGNIGTKCYNKFSKDFHIKFIIDNDAKKQGYYHGVEVCTAKDFIKKADKYKIIVMTGGKVYRNIANDLKKLGLIENKDFCSMEIFISDWYWEKYHQNCILEIHTAVSMKCSFNCQNCNMFVPYYKGNTEYSLKELKEDFDILFEFVDYVFSIVLLGGEPLLYGQLGELIEYICKTYKERFTSIGIVTNGSILPNEAMINIIKKYNVNISISDYTSTIPYQKRIKELTELFDRNDIEYKINPSMLWRDFGFPMKKATYTSKNVREHMLTCAPVFHGLNDGKLYYCHVSWSAEKCGLYQLKHGDYMNLKEIKANDENKRRVVEYSLGNLENGYVSMCSICGGCGQDNPNVIEAGIQSER